MARYFSWLLLVSALPLHGAVCTVDWNTVYQHIDGFGASSAYHGTWTTAQANMFFSTNSGTGVSLDAKTNFPFAGCGFSLLRNKITYYDATNSFATPTTFETGLMQKAAALGVQVWSAPWTPPRGFKNSFATNGGNYLGHGNNATNLAYANQLASYVASVKNTYGVTLYALSIQNEPDYNTLSYESCLWTGAQFHDFVTNLYAALAAKGVGSTRIMLPESANWGSNPGLFTPTLSDPVAAAEVGIIANHDYVPDNITGDTNPPAPVATSGKALWETEVSQINGTYDGSITNALYWAGRIHLFMTVAQANAWHYWWLLSLNNDNEGLLDTNGVPAKRMYALGQFARFVRPNYYRINVTNNTGSLQISAYKDSSSSNSTNFAIVAINSSSLAVTQTFILTNIAGISSVTPWLTSSNFSLTNLPAVAVANSNFTYTLPALSIVTFAGKSVTNAPPVFAAVTNQLINPGTNFALTISVTDTPPQTLTYILLSAPTNATLNTNSGIFSWRPLLSQADTTNAVTVKATDDGMPNLSATNSFQVTVNPIVAPSVSANFNAGSGVVNLILSGASGPDYSLLVSSNLTTWQLLFTTNSPALPVTFIETNTGNFSPRFYRVLIGP